MSTEEMKNQDPINGTHICLELFDCDPNLLDNEQQLTAIILKACDEANATVLSVQSHHFSPQGVTILVLIAESHVSIHTWPEYSYAAADIFTCGKAMDTEKIKKLLITSVGAKDSRDTTILRGLHLHPGGIYKS